jgi:hypothetical protein
MLPAGHDSNIVRLFVVTVNLMREATINCAICGDRALEFSYIEVGRGSSLQAEAFFGTLRGPSSQLASRGFIDTILCCSFDPVSRAGSP